MANTTATPASVTSFSNTPQAADDLLLAAQSGLTEDSTNIIFVDVMVNDLGGNAKSLWSIDDGFGVLTATKILAPVDLLTQDLARAQSISGDRSANGANIWITSDGKVGYDANSLNATFRAQLQHLSVGESMTDNFTYAIRLGNGTLSWATATLQINGTNDAPVITNASTALAGAVTEDTTLTATGQLSASDVDKGATQAWSVQGAAAGSYGSLAVNVAGQWTYTLNNAANQNLAAGETHAESFTVRVTDDKNAFVDQTVSITVNGTNDAPVITSAAQSGSVSEGNGAAAGAMSASGTVAYTDADLSDVHTLTASAASYGTATVNQQGVWGYTVIDAGAVNALAAGEKLNDSFTVSVDDSQGGNASQTVNIVITGTNDIAVIGGIKAGSVTEDTNVTSGLLRTSGILTVSDADHDQSSFLAQSSTFGSAGLGNFSLNTNGAWNYSVSNSNATVQALKAGQTLTDSFTALSSDGQSTQMVTVTINGQDEPVINVKGFESGTLSGWTSLGDVKVESAHGSYRAYEGTYFAALYANGANASQIESFLGVASNSMTNLGNGSATTGAALKTTVDVKAGQIVHFDWAFQATDYLPFNDFAVAFTGNGQLIELADVQMVGDFGTTGWRSFDYTVASDMIMVIGVATSNVLDNVGSSELLIDNMRII